MAKPKNKNKNRVKTATSSTTSTGTTKQDTAYPEGLSAEERAKYQAAMLPHGTLVAGIRSSDTDEAVRQGAQEVFSLNYYCQTEDLSSKHNGSRTTFGFHSSVRHYSAHDLKLLGIPQFVPGCHEPGLFLAIYEEIQKRYNPTYLDERLKLNLFDVLHHSNQAIAAQFTLTMLRKKEKTFGLKGTPCLRHYYEQVTSQMPWSEVKLHFVERFRFFTCKYDYLLYLDECLGEIRLQWGKHRRFFNHVRGWLNAVESVQPFEEADRADVLKAIFLLVPYDRQYFCMPEDIDTSDAPYEKRVGDCLDAYEARCDYLLKEFDKEIYDKRVAEGKKPHAAAAVKTIELGEMEKCNDSACPGSTDVIIEEVATGCPQHEMDDYVAGETTDGAIVCASLTRAIRNPIKLDLDAPHCHVHIGFSSDAPAMKALVSTGTFACCIKQSVVDNLGLGGQVTKLKAAEYIPSGGGPLRFESVLNLPLWFPSGHLKINRFVIVDGLPVPMIIGSDFVHYHNAMVTLRGYSLSSDAPSCPSYMRVLPSEDGEPNKGTFTTAKAAFRAPS